MMSFMRGLLKSKLSGIVFGLIILSMAVWGVGDIFGGGLGNDVVKAGDRALTISAFDRKFENYLRNVRDQTGESMTRDEAVERGVVDQLYSLETSRIINLGFSDSIGASASNAAVDDNVQNNDAFKNPQTQRFDRETYLSRLDGRRLSTTEYEQEIRDGITLEYLREAIGASVQAPLPLARLRASFDGEIRRIAWMTLSPDSVPELEDPTDEELLAFFESRIEGFKEPERRALSVLTISPDDFIGLEAIEDTDIEAVYEATKAQRFSGPETRVFTQVLFSSESASRLALGLLATGEDPATISGAENAEQRAALKIDIANAPLAEAMYSYGQQPGAVFGPFPSGDLWLIARLDEIQLGDPFPLASVMEVIRAELARERAEGAYYDAIDGFDDLIGEGLDLFEMGARLGVPVMSYLPVDTRGIAANGAIMRNYFGIQEGLIAAQDYTAGEISERFDIEDGIYMIQLDRIVAESTPAFEDIKDQAAEAYAYVKRNEGVQGFAEAIKSRIETEGSTLDAEAAAIGAELNRPDRGLNRTTLDAGLPPSVLTAIFATAEGDILTLPGAAAGQVLIVQVEAVELPNEEALSVLAPLSMGTLGTDLNNDLLALMEVEIQRAISVKTNAASVDAYKTRITETQ